MRALVVKVIQGALDQPFDESGIIHRPYFVAIVRLFEMSVRTAKSFINFEEGKVMEFMQLAEEVKCIKQMHLVCFSTRH